MVGSKLKTEQKKLRMTADSVAAYNARQQALLAPLGPCFLLDMHRLSAGCSQECTEDGIHYSDATFDASLQQWAAALWTMETERGWCPPAAARGGNGSGGGSRVRRLRLRQAMRRAEGMAAARDSGALKGRGCATAAEPPPAGAAEGSGTVRRLLRA